MGILKKKNERNIILKLLVLSVFINVDSGLTKDEEKCINSRVELAALVNGLELGGVEKV